MPDKIKIKDTRNVPANKKFNYNVNPELVKKLVMGSNIRNIDPATTLAIALQETGINPINPLHYNSYDKEVNIDDSLDFLKKNYNYAKRLGKTSDADTIQAWNGYGKIKALADEGKLYGTDKLIDMNKTPLYGERVAALRDSAIMQTPEIVDIIKNYATGGEMTKTINSKFLPTFYDGVPMYAAGGEVFKLGEFLKANKGDIASSASQASGMFGGGKGGSAASGALSGLSAGAMFGPIGMGVGALVGGAAGFLGANAEEKAMKEQMRMQQQEAIKQNLLSKLPSEPNYVPTFKKGGEIKKYPKKYKGHDLVTGADGKALLDKNGNPVYLPATGMANLTSSPIDAALIGATSVGPTALRWIGSNILGNTMADFQSQLPEAGLSISGLVKTPISEDMKRIGGFNDLKQSKAYFKEGKIGKGIWNAVTGGAGIYDSNLTNTKIDDLIDKPIEYINAGGDVVSGVGGLKELKGTGGEITDRVSEIKSGTTHEQSPLNGVPIGKSALVEDSEVIFTNKNGKKYVFSTRF